MTENPYLIQINKRINFDLVSSLFFIVIVFLLIFIFDKQIAIYAALSFVGLSIIFVFFRYLYLKSISYSVDTNDFTFKGGIISRFEKILPYSKIQHVITYESFWQRVLGLSSLSIETARQSGMQYGLQYGRGNQDNNPAAMKNPVIPDLKREEAEKLKNYIITASNLKYKPVAGV